MVDRLHILLSRHARRGVALFTALVVLATAVGIPVPQYRPKDTSRPFPCMHHACGCTTAASCWQGCCCMSDEQKLAWAKQHGVTPPKEFSPQAIVVTKKSCCSADQCDDLEAQPPAESAGGWSLVRIEALRKCQGLASLWMILGQALPPPECDSFEADLSVVSWLAPSSAAQVLSPAFEPATPPPRAAI